MVSITHLILKFAIVQNKFQQTNKTKLNHINHWQSHKVWGLFTLFGDLAYCVTPQVDLLWFVFWRKWKTTKDVSKLTDLYLLLKWISQFKGLANAEILIIKHFKEIKMFCLIEWLCRRSKITVKKIFAWFRFSTRLQKDSNKT